MLSVSPSRWNGAKTRPVVWRDARAAVDDAQLDPVAEALAVTRAAAGRGVAYGVLDQVGDDPLEQGRVAVDRRQGAGMSARTTRARRARGRPSASGTTSSRPTGRGTTASAPA